MLELERLLAQAQSEKMRIIADQVRHQCYLSSAELHSVK